MASKKHTESTIMGRIDTQLVIKTPNELSSLNIIPSDENTLLNIDSNV